MKKMTRMLVACVAALACLAPVRAQTGYKPTPENLAAREWFQDARFGMFVHWGVYSVLGDGEWVMNNRKIRVAEYEKLPAFFNPVDFDPAAWVALVKAAGMKYITITSKHHDGFAMFDSKVSDWDIVDRTPYKRDVLKMLADECHRQGIKLFFYHSQLDWHHPDYYPRGHTGHDTGRPESGEWYRYLDYMDAQLKELLTRARYREQVLDVWKMGGPSARRRGLTALFAGPSGTGKTMAAEVLASELGLDLYTVDLATVVDKYVGETEKNLDRIFAEAERVNGVILFDEADALFGKRSEVSDAHDRYANVEVAYLLQRMELFEGIAILATNLRANLDEAFTRRLDALVDFPDPEEEYRRRLWERSLGTTMPRDANLDLDFLARAFKLSGGAIRNIVVAAAYAAAEDQRAMSMADLIRATHREYLKMGLLTVESEFGPYYQLLVDR